MKICLINNLYKPYDKGGAEVYTSKLFNQFVGLGHEVFVVSTKPYQKSSRNIKNVYYLKSLFFNLDRMPKFFRLFWHIFNLFNLLKYFQIRGILRKQNPNLIISNNLMGLGFLLPRLFKKLNIKHLHVLHDIQLLHPGGLVFLGEEKILENNFVKIYQKINIYLFSGVKFVIAPSTWILRMHKERGFFTDSARKMIFNPIDTPEVISKNKNKNNFVYLGQLEEHKGIRQLLKVFSEIVKKDKKIHLDIIGDGSLLSILKTKFENKNIIFIGRIKREDLDNKISKYGCLFAPSLCYENSPTVIYEAASLGVDFIYSNIGGAVEIGEYLGGIPFYSYDNHSLNNAIKQYLKNNYTPHDNNKNIFNLSTKKYIEKLFKFIEII